MIQEWNNILQTQAQMTKIEMKDKQYDKRHDEENKSVLKRPSRPAEMYNYNNYTVYTSMYSAYNVHYYT